MIYLIGGAPRVGKSIVAQKVAETVRSKIISTDDLCSNISRQLSEEERRLKFPHGGFSGNPLENTLTPKERVDLQIRSARSLEEEVDRRILSTIETGESVVIEGVHLLPSHVSSLVAAHGAEYFQTLFIGSQSTDQIVEGILQNTSPNNWLRTSKPVVIRQVAEFAAAFSKYISTECLAVGLAYYERTTNFEADIEQLTQHLPFVNEPKISVK